MKRLKTMIVVLLAVVTTAFYVPEAYACARFLITQDPDGNVIICTNSGEDANYCYYTC